MQRQILIDCLPWLILLVATLLVARILIWMSGAKLNLKRVFAINRSQEGSVQSLSFVLTLPLFIMIMMFIVQISQVMIATVLVHYAAYASVRSASVWIPADIGGDETENRISSIAATGSGGSEGVPWVSYEVSRSDYGKYQKIKQAAVLACLPLAPSRNVGYSLQSNDQLAAYSLYQLYSGLDAESLDNTRIPARLSNKLAYSRENTDVLITFKHDLTLTQTGNWWGWYREPPLQVQYGIGPNYEEFQYNELGWRDHLTATVTHRMALLPGPGRLLARSTGSYDRVSDQVSRNGVVDTWAITASATMGNEGEKSIRPYQQQVGR